MNSPAAMISVQDLVIVAPMIALFVVSLIPLMMKVLRGNREADPVSTLIWNFIGLVIAAGLTASFVGVKKTAFHDALVMDGISLWMSFVVYIATGVALMLAYDNVATKGRQFTEFCFLMTSSLIGMLILIMSNDLIVTFIGIEMMSLCLYILVAMSREEVLSKEAAFKYFVLGSFGSAIFLYGVSFIYGTTGSTMFPVISQSITTMVISRQLFLLGLSMVALGFCFKVAIFPLHAWAPDVYQGAATPVTAFMATAVKAASFVGFLRLFNSPGLAASMPLLHAMTWLAALTMMVGNTAALLQDNVKRMLAYSSVAHSGYAMIGLIAAGFGNQFQAAAASLLFYLFTYSLMTLGSFALVCAFERNENISLSVKDLRGLSSRNPVMALSLTVLMLSLAGIPPTLGFFSKFYVFSAAIDQDMYWLPFWGVIASVISVYFYLRPVVMMYMSEEQGAEVVRTQYLTRMTVVVSAVLIVILGICASPLLKAVQASMQTLL